MTDDLHKWRPAAYKASRERDHARAAIARVERWAATTEHGRAAAEVMLLLGQPATLATCDHASEFHCPEAGCVECRCTSTVKHG